MPLFDITKNEKARNTSGFGLFGSPWWRLSGERGTIQRDKNPPFTSLPRGYLLLYTGLYTFKENLTHQNKFLRVLI